MQVGKQVGPFTIEKELGRGAMGTVYLARYTKTDQLMAIKAVSPQLSGDESTLARFEREAIVLKQLSHPNIVRLHGTGRYKNAPFYVMEYIEGESLDKLLIRRGRMHWKEVATIGKQVCSALQHAHEQGIIHRDLKPSNLMLTTDGTVKLTDFGIAKHLDMVQLTATHCAIGTAAYMSPEQCRAVANLTAKSDLYSLGVMFYELLTGRLPFHAESAVDMFMQHVKGKFPRPARLVMEIPPWFDTLVCHLLEKEPEKRPLDAALVAEVLATEGAGVSSNAATDPNATAAPSTGRPSQYLTALYGGTEESDLTGGRKKKRKRPMSAVLVVEALGLTLLLAGIVGVLIWALMPPGPEELFNQAQKLMASEDAERWKEAQKGPIRDFLRRYPADARAEQMRAWDDQMRVHDLSARLQAKLKFARSLKRDVKPENEAEALAYQGLHFEDFGDLYAARDVWREVKQQFGGEADERVWALLADKKSQELAGKLPSSAKDVEERQARRELVEQKLSEAIELKAKKQNYPARLLCQNIIDLYQKDHDPALVELAGKANQLLSVDAK